MTSDDMLAYLANTRPCHRPTELRGDKKMLLAWLAMRNHKEFFQDVILRHGLDKIGPAALNRLDPMHEHAISNAWGHCMQFTVIG